MKIPMTARRNPLLRIAVENNPERLTQRLLQKLFTFWFDGFVYNQIWEDPEVDIEALELEPTSKVLTIASGGCNLLNYLIKVPQSIDAVDLNPYHIYLSRLKIAAIRHLPSYEDFFEFFGSATNEQNIVRYERFIKPHLDQDSRIFWEGSSWLQSKFREPRIRYFRKNFYNYTRSGYFLRFVHAFFGLYRCNPAEILRSDSQQEQEIFFETYIAPVFDQGLVKILGEMPFVLYSLGVPPQQLETMRQEEKTSLSEIYRERIKRLACGFPIAQNYFAWQAFGRCYNQLDTTALPMYLRPENFEFLRGQTDRINTHVSTLTDFLKKKPASSLDRFVFLDSQDWMNHLQLESLWQEIIRVGKDGSRIIFRTAARKSPLEVMLPQELRSRLDYQEQRSLELFQKDRSAIYGGFHLYCLNK